MSDKILLFSDLHVHMHKNQMSRLEDGLRVLEWIFKTAIENQIDVLVFGGDLYQDRQRIHTISYEKTFSLIRQFMENYPQLKLYLLVGNHDMWFNDKWNVSSIAPMEAIRGVNVVNKVCTIEIIPGFKLDFIPYTKNPLEDIATKFTTKSDVLVSHIAIDGAQLNSFHNMKAEVSVEFEGDMVKVDLNNFNEWKKVFLGHYHCAQKLNDVVEYIGSPMELNFGEAFQQKHIIILDTKTLETKYVVNDFSPKHLIIKESQIEAYDLEGNFVQILVEDIASTNIVDVRKQILSNNKNVTLEFKENKKEKGVENISTKDKFDFADGEILERYVSVSNKELDPIKLLAIGKEICQNV
jgi:DNA repair exonuclease SbcCD nuclease subunit